MLLRFPFKPLLLSQNLFLPSFLPLASGVHSAGQHLSGWVVLGQVTFVCHCFAPHTSPREKGKELSALHLPLSGLDFGVPRTVEKVPNDLDT